MNSYNTFYEEPFQAALFLKSQGFRNIKSGKERLSEFALDKNGKPEFVRGQMARGKETAVLFRKKEGYEIVVYDAKGHIIVPKCKKKPGPKPSKDKKQRIVLFINKSVIKKMGGADNVRVILCDYATNYSESGILSPVDFPPKEK